MMGIKENISITKDLFLKYFKWEGARSSGKGAIFSYFQWKKER
ncbi:hypothetical protein BSM4216_0462 [Bacillus smithii]|nr:hypothetical protein BSM4216_0462 [Bacillus smithii]